MNTHIPQILFKDLVKKIGSYLKVHQFKKKEIILLKLKMVIMLLYLFKKA